MEKALKDKLDKIVLLVNDLMVDPDVHIEYCIPEIATTSDSCDLSGEPYILVKYVISDYHVPTRKIRLTNTYLKNSPQKIANMITASLEEFKMEIDSVEMG